MKVSWSEHYTMGIPEIDEDTSIFFGLPRSWSIPWKVPRE